MQNYWAQQMMQQNGGIVPPHMQGGGRMQLPYPNFPQPGQGQFGHPREPIPMPKPPRPPDDPGIPMPKPPLFGAQQMPWNQADNQQFDPRFGFRPYR